MSDKPPNARFASIERAAARPVPSRLAAFFLTAAFLAAGPLLHGDATVNAACPGSRRSASRRSASLRPELGDIRWNRSLDKAQAMSAETGAPVFALFQEVPGCDTCVSYGTRVLSHPLIAEAVETLFVPLAVFNNGAGGDREALERFGEPAWNNPVVRIVDSEGRGLVKRLAGDYTIAGTAGAMIEALQKADRDVPFYLEAVRAENAPFTRPEKAIFSMFCFWSGEIDLGRIEGVVSTRSGFVKGREAVEVKFDPSVVTFEGLLEQAERIRCAERVFALDDTQWDTARRVLPGGKVERAAGFRADRQVKYYMSKTAYRFIPLTPVQAIRVNRALYEGLDPAAFLSNRQRAMLDFVERHPGLGWPDRTLDEDFAGAWHDTLSRMEGSDRSPEPSR